MALSRGNVVLIAEGKPTPAVIVQADALPTPTNILACPLSSDLTDTGLYRIAIRPSPENGLRVTSQAMTDRVGPVRRERISMVIGRLTPADMQRLGDALALVLDLTA